MKIDLTKYKKIMVETFDHDTTEKALKYFKQLEASDLALYKPRSSDDGVYYVTKDRYGKVGRLVKLTKKQEFLLYL